MSNTITLSGKEIFGLRRLGEYAYADDTQLKGEKYYRYTAKGTVFTVNTKEGFNKDFDAKNIAECSFIVREETTDKGIVTYWSYDYHVTQDQLINHVTFEAKLKAIESGAMVSKAVSVAELEDLA